MTQQNELNSLTDAYQESIKPTYDDAFKNLLEEDDNEKFEGFFPYGGRLLIKFIPTAEVEKFLVGKTVVDPTGKEINIWTPSESQTINNNLNAGKIIKVGQFYNQHIDKWVKLEEFFFAGDIILFEQIKYTPIFENYALLPVDSVHCKVGKTLDVLKDILKKSKSKA